MSFIYGDGGRLREAQIAGDHAQEEVENADKLCESKYVDESAAAALRSIAWSMREGMMLARLAMSALLGDKVKLPEQVSEKGK